MQRPTFKCGVAVLALALALLAGVNFRDGFLVDGPPAGFVSTKGTVVGKRLRFRASNLPPVEVALVCFHGPHGPVEFSDEFTFASVGKQVPVTYETNNPQNASVGNGRLGNQMLFVFATFTLIALALAITKLANFA